MTVEKKLIGPDTNPGTVTSVDQIIGALRETNEGEVVRICEGELDPKTFNNVAVLRELILAAKRGVEIKVIAGPIAVTEPRVETIFTFDGEGSEEIIRDLGDWLSPLVEANLMSFSQDETKMQIAGPKTTVESFSMMCQQAFEPKTS